MSSSAADVQSDKHKEVQEYYGQTLAQSEDLKTNACCTVTTYPDPIKKLLSQIHDEVLMKYYGCGLTIPNELEGLRVLDLGSGAGRDCYLLSGLVGEKGSVVGVDMTEEQLSVARRHIPYHTEKFNYSEPNVEFREGHIEKLDEINLKDEEFDLIVSNCVVNLANDKEAVLREAFRVLKEGGEFYFSDVYCDRRIPTHLRDDKVLYGECLSGALYWNDFQNLAQKVGFTAPRVVEIHPITIENADVQKRVEGYTFTSVTYRLFKIAGLEPACEDYGQAVIYKGSMNDAPVRFTLDNEHTFEKDRVQTVCGNTYRMLNETRFQPHFDFIGSFEQHFGLYEDCGTSPSDTSQTPSTSENSSDTSSGACC